MQQYSDNLDWRGVVLGLFFVLLVIAAIAGTVNYFWPV